MTKEMKVRDLLVKLWVWASCGLDMPERDYGKDKFIDQSLSQLKALLKNEMPKKLTEEDTLNADYAQGHNDYREQMEEVIERLLK